MPCRCWGRRWNLRGNAEPQLRGERRNGLSGGGDHAQRLEPGGAQGFDLSTRGGDVTNSLGQSRENQPRARHLGLALDRIRGAKRLFGPARRRSEISRRKGNLGREVERVGEVTLGVDFAQPLERPLDVGRRLGLPMRESCERAQRGGERELASFSQLGGERLELGAAVLRLLRAVRIRAGASPIG